MFLHHQEELYLTCFIAIGDGVDLKMDIILVAHSILTIMQKSMIGK